MSDWLAVLFETHWNRLYRLARRLVPTTDDALDLVQETFLKAARSAPTIPCGLAEEEAWLVRVLINTRRDQWRKETVRNRYAQQASATPPHPADPETSFVIRTSVWRALDHLPPRRRAIVVMHEIEGLSIASIASLLGITAITVRWHLSLARRELMRALKFELGETDEQQLEQSLAGRRSCAIRRSGA